jgi:CelD/BcsL family acetyltransferase involved in cellulose biosynthesis
MLSFEVINDSDWPALLENEWKELFINSKTATPFQSYEWLLSWWEAFGRDRLPHVLVMREGRDLVGLMPLYKRKNRTHVLASMGEVESDYLLPLTRDGYDTEFSNHMISHFRELQGVDYIEMHALPETSSVLKCSAKMKIVQEDLCYLITLPSSYEEYLAGLSSNFRHKPRRILKGPFLTGEARAYTLDDPQETEKALDRLLELHERRWSSKGFPGAFYSEAIKQLHFSYVRRACISGQLRMNVLEIDGACVGLLYAMRHGDTYYYYQKGYDPDYTSHSPGVLLIGYSIKSAIEEGAKYFDFMRGDEPYKLNWKPQRCFSNKILRIPVSAKGALVLRVREIQHASAIRRQKRVDADNAIA